MVHEIIQNKFRIFIESLILTILIFIIGFSMGFLLEAYRVNKIVSDYKDNEIQALDLKLQNYYYQIMDRSSCDSAIKQNFIFADKIYGEGLLLEKYEEASQISENIIVEKKRYVLLKTELWLNTILLKEKCGEDNFDTIVYLYSNNPRNPIVLTQQKMLSKVLEEIKKERGNNVILLPIAGDLGLDSVSLQRRIYKIDNLPSIIVNEKDVLEGFNDKKEIEKYLS